MFFSSTNSTFLIIAAIYEQFGDYPKAIEYYQKALNYENNVFTSEDFQDFKIETLLSSVYTKLGDYNQSQIILKKIYNKCSQILNYNNSVWLDNRLEDATSQSELAFVYERLGDMNTASQIIHQNKGFDFENSINPKLKNLYFNQIKMVFNQANDQIAENYYYLGDLDSSMKYCELQYENYNEISSAKSLLIKSWIYLDENNIEKASEYARLAYLQAKLSWSKLEVCPYLIQLAKIKNKQKNYNEAIEFATKSSKLVQLSVELIANCLKSTMTPNSSPISSTLKIPSVQEAIGGLRSLTVKVKLQVLVFPQSSETVNLTLCVPTG